jgi:hemerythrin-like metal-binding protein/diguanylate cyclase (GGDEF)-like protein
VAAYGIYAWLRRHRARHWPLGATLEPPTDNLRSVQHLPAASGLEHLEFAGDFRSSWRQESPEQAISAELARAARCRLPVALLLVAIDDFGHSHDLHRTALVQPVMDELVHRIRSVVRSCDIVHRWNRQKLLVLAAGSGCRAGEGLAGMLRDAVAGKAFTSVGRVTISVGVAQPGANETTAALLLRVEGLLERTRSQGTGRVVVDHRDTPDEFARDARASPLALVWHEDYESGHAELDCQHRYLFGLANALLDATLGRNDDRERTDELMGALLEYIQHHFSDEEALLARIGYERLAEHRDAHAQLLARAIALREQAAAGTLELGLLVEFLCRDVLVRHILATDQHFFPLLAARPGA